MESRFYVERLNRITPAQKTIDLDKHLQKFDEFKQKQDQKIAEDSNRDDNRELNIKANFRSQKREKLQRVISFGTNWAQDGLKAGAANLKIQREREKKDREFKIKQVNKVEDVRTVARGTTQKEMIDQIDKFENQFLQNQEKSTDADDNSNDPNYMMSSGMYL